MSLDATKSAWDVQFHEQTSGSLKVLKKNATKNDGLYKRKKPDRRHQAFSVHTSERSKNITTISKRINRNNMMMKIHHVAEKSDGSKNGKRSDYRLVIRPLVFINIRKSKNKTNLSNFINENNNYLLLCDLFISIKQKITFDFRKLTRIYPEKFIMFGQLIQIAKGGGK